jgi:uncharacterized protein YkwD
MRIPPPIDYDLARRAKKAGCNLTAHKRCAIGKQVGDSHAGGNGRGIVMRLFALPAVVLLWAAAASLGLTGCGSLMPSAEVLSSAPAAAAETGPEGILAVTASLALGNIFGAPQQVTDRMVRMLDAASRRADLALLNYTGAQGDYRLQGDLRADMQGYKIRVSYRWQVFDRTGVKLAGIAGAEMVSGTDADLWGAVSDATLQSIAGRGIGLVVRVAKGGAPGAAAPASLGQSSPSAAVETASIAPGSGEPPASSNQEMFIDTSQALLLVNDFRRLNGLPPLAPVTSLDRAAMALAADMAKNNRLSHTGPNGANLARRLKAAGYSFGLAAENIGAGQSSLAELIESWKNDPSQSRNLLIPDATQMGIAYKYRPDTNFKTFWTLVVAAP